MKNMNSKYLDFVHIEDKPKTKVWDVQSKVHGFSLGRIKYCGALKKYSFYPHEGMLFGVGDLREITGFLADEEEIRKAKYD